MAQFNLLHFQRTAVEELSAQFKTLWLNPDHGYSLTFKSPTGSGKTVMVCNFLNSLHGCADWNEDVAFVWITFSDELAMQSKQKFYEYFFPNLSNTLLTVQDITSQGILNKDDILFLNWQKLVSKKASDRVLRRPEDERLTKEQGFYFEDLVEATHATGREIVMIIDESHKNVTDAAMRDVINPLNPKIILKVSATPENEPSISDVKHGKAGFVEVEREDVIKEGLIKEEILSQTEEDLNVFANTDHDILLLDLAMEKREALQKEWQRLGLNINPLVLIQLPDDEKKLLETGTKSKEQIVDEYLQKKGVDSRHIAKWFDNKKENLDHITDLDSPIEYMLFKYAAGTGWDCPRAHILVMYREIQSDTFRTQTLGRILRNPVPDIDLSGYPSLRIGYLYTNYRRNEVQNPHTIGENRPRTQISQLNLQPKIQFATEIFSEEVGEKLRQTIGYKYEDKTKVNTLLAHVIPVAKAASEVIAQTVVTEKDLQNQQTKIQKHTRELVQQVEQQVSDLFAGYADVVNAPQVTNEILDYVYKLTATAAGRRDQDLVIDPILKSDFMPRGDYGDVGRVSDFQSSFIQSMNSFFHVPETILDIHEQQELLRKNGIDPNPLLERDVLVNARFINIEDDNANDIGNTIKQEISDNDAEKEFTWKCYQILQEQTEDNAKIGNIARSWGPFKEALRQWFGCAIPRFTTIQQYKIFLRDLNKGENSIFRRAITQAMIEYLPKRDEAMARKMELLTQQAATTFVIKAQYAFADDEKEFSPSFKSIVQPFRLRDKYNGRDNETDFIKYIESNSNKIEWWFKNGTGKESFGIKYTDSTTNKDRIFYPDWIIKFYPLIGERRGKIGIFDTKLGNTASSLETKDKAEVLHRKLGVLNHDSQNFLYIGGVVVKRDGIWYFNNNPQYLPIETKRSDWIDFATLL